MIPNLPRELLWRDKTDMSEFMSEELGNTVISAFNFAKSRIVISLGSKMMLRLYNEGFYLSTRVVYEHGAAANPESYKDMIIGDLGKKELAEHVILIMFMILTLQPDKSKEILLFTDKLQKQYLQDTPFKLLNWIHKVFKPRKNKASFTLKPCPYPAYILKNFSIDWCQITQGFSKHVIIDMLDLWQENNERGKVLRLIEQAYTSCYLSKEEKTVDTTDETFFAQQMRIYNMTTDGRGISDFDSNPYDISNYFRHNSVFVKDEVKKLVKKFYNGKSVNLALIEIVLFDHGVLTKRENHTSFIMILKDWALPHDINEATTANGMSQKIRKLPKIPYQEWDDKYLKDRQRCITIGNKLHQTIAYGR